MYTLKERKERIRFLTKRMNNLQKTYDQWEEDNTKIILEKRESLLDLIESNTDLYTITRFDNRNLILSLKETENTPYYRPKIEVQYDECSEYNHDTHSYDYTYQFSRITLQNMTLVGNPKTNNIEDFSVVEGIISGLEIYKEIAEDWSNKVDNNFLINIENFHNEFYNNRQLKRYKLSGIISRIKREIETHNSEIENDKIRPLIKKGVWFKRTRVDDNGRQIRSMYYHIFKITAKCTFFNEFDEHGRNTRKEDSYWNENQACRRLTHDEFIGQVRSSDYGTGVYMTKEFTPIEHSRRHYGGYISKLELKSK